jgi:NhaP-type Na+/H+ or K+/H+ antiporter
MSKLTRRRFLATLGVSGAGAAAAALAARSPAPQHAGQPGKDKSQSLGYKVTAHVRNYYRTARV